MNNNGSIAPAAQQSAAIGEVIFAARQLEGALRRLTGPTEVAGLHALTELLGSRLPENVRNQLHYAATIRNRAAHEENFMMPENELQSFKQTTAKLLNLLNTLAAESASSQAEVPAPQEPEFDSAVERELFARLSARLARLGYFPVVGNIYLLYVLFYTIFIQGHLVILTALYFCAAVLGIKGYFSEQDRGLLYAAGISLLFAYTVTAVISCKAPVKQLPKAIGLLPFINIVYLLAAFLTKLKWGRFSCAVLGLASSAAAIYLLTRSLYKYSIAALIASWIISAAAALFWGRKNEEQ